MDNGFYLYLRFSCYEIAICASKEQEEESAGSRFFQAETEHFCLALEGDMIREKNVLPVCAMLCAFGQS